MTRFHGTGRSRPRADPTRSASRQGSGVAEHMKMTFFRSPVYLQPSLPSQSVSYSKVGMRNWPDPRWMIFVGSSLSRMM